jgi:protein bicaudal D
MLASQEIEQLRADLQELEKGLTCSDATLQLRTEVTNLKNKVHECYPIVIDIEFSPCFCTLFL